MEPALAAIGHSLSDIPSYRVEDGRILISIADNGEADETLRKLVAALPDGAQADWTGSSNTDHAGDTTSDCAITWLSSEADEAKPRPNYRIYDRTGGGVTHDIYAETLEAAIEAGREWIENGDWSGGDHKDGKTYKTIKLECEVGPIVYRPDTAPLDKALIEYYVESDDAGIYTIVEGNNADDVTKLRDRVQRAGLGDLVEAPKDGIRHEADDVIVLRLVPATGYPEAIDEDATTKADTHDCSGQYSDEIPLCEQRLCEAATSAGDEYAPHRHLSPESRGPRFA